MGIRCYVDLFVCWFGDVNRLFFDGTTSSVSGGDMRTGADGFVPGRSMEGNFSSLLFSTLLSLIEIFNLLCLDWKGFSYACFSSSPAGVYFVVAIKWEWLSGNIHPKENGE